MESFWDKISHWLLGADSWFENGFFGTLLSVMGLCLVAFILVLLIDKGFKKWKGKNPEKRTNMPFLIKILQITILVFTVLGILYQFKPLRSVSTSILATSGVLAIAISLAAQEGLSNLIGGMFIFLFRPFVIGDRVALLERNLTGFVEEINLQHTVLRTFQNSRVIIPNSIMNSAVLDNMNRVEQNVCSFLELPVSVHADIRRAIDIIQNEIIQHPLWRDTRSEEQRAEGAAPVTASITGISETTCTLRAPVWAENPGDGWTACCELRLKALERFRAEGIALPEQYFVVSQKDSR